MLFASFSRFTQKYYCSPPPIKNDLPFHQRTPFIITSPVYCISVEVSNPIAITPPPTVKRGRVSWSLFFSYHVYEPYME